MKRALIIAMLCLASLATALPASASGIAPKIVEHGGSKAIELGVENVWEDYSWSHITFNEAAFSDYEYVYVSFDIYRVGAPGHWLQNLRYGWDATGTNPKPVAGFQWDHYGQPANEPWTYPFYDSDEHAITQTGRWTNLTMKYYYDPTSPYADSYYDGGAVDLGFPVSGIDSFSGFYITLGHEAATNNGLYDIAWIDNLKVYGKKSGFENLIYDSNGFEDFELGDLDGQNGWYAGSENGAVVPVPAAVWLLGSGLVGLLGLRRKMRD